jgi:hypothetical protein
VNETLEDFVVSSYTFLMSSDFDKESNTDEQLVYKLENQPSFKFDVEPWSPVQVLEYWESMHGTLSESWKKKFLEDPNVIEICNQHPAHIREAIKYRPKIVIALSHIYAVKERNEKAADKLLDELRPNHSIGITNAHHGNRTTDPFDPERDDLLFKCSKCNLKLSLRRRSNEGGSESICKSCSGED